MKYKHYEEQMYQRLIDFFSSEAELAKNLQKSECTESREWADIYRERCERYIKVFELSINLLKTENYADYIKNKKMSSFHL